MKIKLKISLIHILKSILICIIVALSVLVLMSFANKFKKGEFVDKSKPIVFINEIDESFISKKKIVDRIKTLKMWKAKDTGYQILSEIESDISKNSYVKSVAVYVDSKGEINIKMTLHKPIARLARDDSSDAYITSDGYIKSKDLPVPLRLLVITGDFTKKLINHNENEKSKLITKDFLGLLHEINTTNFYKSIIAQLDINEDGEITVIPQVGKQRFLLGTAKNYKKKLKKLELTYTNIFPIKGWGYYKELNLKFKNQIIAY